VRGRGAAGAVIVFELRVRALSLKRLIGAVAGSVLGILGAALFCLVLRAALPLNATSAVIQIFVLLLMTYVGLLVGRQQGRPAEPVGVGHRFRGRKVHAPQRQGAGHQRHHRRPHRRHRRGRLY
jgi:uncharacterized protein YacL